MNSPRTWSKQKKSLATLLGAGVAAVLLLNGLESEPGSSVNDFNPEGSIEVQRALAEEKRDLIGKITAYDTSTEMTLPSFYDNFADVWENLLPSDRAVLWYVPKAGGDTLTKIFYHCLKMVVASKMAAMVEGGTDGNTPEVKTDSTVGSFINVDLSTSDGIAKASSWNLAGSEDTKVYVTQRLQESGSIFSSNNRGRLFVLMRQPIKRSAEMFYYRQRATWEPNFDKDLAMMSIEKYSSSDKFVENYVTRTLIGKAEPDLTKEDVALAKDILRRKFFVGIAEPQWYDLSIVKIERYFGWWAEYNVLTNLTVNHCHYDETTKGGHFGTFPKLERGSEAYAKIAVRNWADIEVYAEAKKLFHKQSQFA